LALLEKEPLAKSEIAKLLGKAKPSRYLNHLMRTLVHTGTVAHTIPDKPNSRMQKYRLTPKGKAVIDAQRVKNSAPGKTPFETQMVLIEKLP
jgi:ATP-dependent DNA helicase RecG